MVRTKYVIVIISQLLLFSNIYSQNLIKNGHFDDFDVYNDENLNIVYHPKYWYYDKLSDSHPLYFLTDRFLNPEVIYKIHPEGNLILQGEVLNYIGLRILPKPELVYTILDEPLIKNQNYKLTIDIREFDNSNCIAGLVVGFSKERTDSVDLQKLILNLPDSLNYDDAFYHWTTLEMNYRATGMEKYFIIGAGSPDDYYKIIESDPERYDHKNEFAKRFFLSYCIDNISLVVYNKIEKAKNFEEFKLRLDSVGLNKSIILENIYFDFNKSDLQQESFVILDYLFKYLSENKLVKIEISGHTDDIGTSEFNQKLSFERAKSVAGYLTEKGISENRLKTVGYGFDRPISSNNTEIGRQLNRRVEITITRR